MPKILKNIFMIFALMFIGISGGAIAPTSSHAAVHAEMMSSIKYLHDTIFTVKGITVPVNGAWGAKNPHSMRYMYQMIDTANLIRTGTATDFATQSGRDTKNPVSKVRADKDIKDLIADIIIPTFTFTVSNVSYFDLQMSASGDFKIDWGDGMIDTVKKTDTSNLIYRRYYTQVGTYDVKIYGIATGYNSTETTATISFAASANKDKITSISGNLLKLFPEISGIGPRFYQTFLRCTGLTSLPAELFSDANIAPVNKMFSHIFYGCTGLTSIPGDLFSGINGAPTLDIFHTAFSGCTGLTSIPGDLFAGINGAPAESMFDSTFMDCTGLTSIPGDLFAGINSTPAPSMFRYTFNNCKGLTSIPSDLFAGINGAPASGMFLGTFLGCNSLTSIPGGLFARINGTITPDMFQSTFYECTGLTTVPTGLFGAFTGDAQSGIFYSTFYGCTGLTTIEDGIWDLSGVTGTGAHNAFVYTFGRCTNITSASPTIALGNPTKLWQKFTFLNVGSQAFLYNTQMADYASIPSYWK